MNLQIEPPIYLNALMRDFQLAGGRIVVRDFPDLRSLLALPEPVLMNCTGLGARSLFDDHKVIPIKGQLMVLPPQPEVDYMVDIVNDMVSRKDGVLLGGLSEPNVWTLEPNEEARRRSMAENIKFFGAMK
jgi:glycine/D-amino acid oxidase-like deaminating enzyme